jgi:dynein heavy chain
MISAEKENVPFLKSINVNEGPRKGNVEIWLDDIQKMMVETLKDVTKRAILDVAPKRIDWVRKWVG